MTADAPVFVAAVVNAQGDVERDVLIVQGYRNDFGVRVFRSQDGRSFARDGERLVECPVGGPRRSGRLGCNDQVK